MLNNIVLMGRLTATPELRTTTGGKPVTSFSIAVDRDTQDKKTDFIDVAAFDKNAEFAAKHLEKGRLIGIKGQLRTNEWTDKEGKKRKSYNILAERFYFADSKRAEAPQLEPYSDDDGDLPF